MFNLSKVLNVFKSSDTTALSQESLKESIPTTAMNTYAAMTSAQKVESLEKAIKQQGDYLVTFKEAMKILNRRNTLAIIELQKLVRDIEVRHPDTHDLIDPIMKKVADIVDFKKAYDV